MSGGERDPCWCSLCGIRVPSVQEMSKHLEGKKHLRQLSSAAARLKHGKQSVFVRSFLKDTTQDALKEIFSQFGAVEKVVMDKSVEGPKYAIVEFGDEKAVAATLQLTSPLMLAGRRLVVKPRNSKPTDTSANPSQTTVVAAKAKKSAEGMEVEPTTTPEKLAMNDLLRRLNEVPSVASQFECLVQQQSLSEEDIRKRKELAVRICSALRMHAYPSDSDLAVELYGSAANGFGLRTSDVDLTLLKGSSGPAQDKITEVTLLDELDHARLSSTESSFSSTSDLSAVDSVSPRTEGLSSSSDAAALESVKAELDAIAAVLRHHVADCGRVLSIPKARRPVVRFFHKDLKCHCDLTVNNYLALENTQLLRRYNRFDRRLTGLVHAVRTWAVNHGLSGGSSALLSGYSLSILVIAFLQRTRPPVLPCLQCAPSLPMKNGAREPNSQTLDGWECRVYDGHEPGVNFDPPEKLLHEFFSYYSSFDFETNVVTISTLSPVTINEVVQKSAEQVEKFTAQHQPGLARLHAFRRASLCIQDPFEVTHNVNPNCSLPLVRRFTTTCHSTALLCQSAWQKQAPKPGPTPAGTLSTGDCAQATLANSSSLTNWGLAQVLASPSTPSMRYLSLSLSSEQAQALCAAASQGSPSPVDPGTVLHRVVGHLAQSFGFETSCRPIPADEGNDDGMHDSEEESEDGDDEHPAVGKAKRSSQSVRAAKRIRDDTSPLRAADSVDLGSSRYQAFCEARTNTWVHRRRWRRKELRKDSSDATKAGGSEYGRCLAAASTEQPVLIAFQLHLFQEPGAPKPYTVVFQPADGKYMDDLHTFVAIFRKDLLRIISTRDGAVSQS